MGVARFDSAPVLAMENEWYCQWCEVWHVGKTNCEGQKSRERAMNE